MIILLAYQEPMLLRLLQMIQISLDFIFCGHMFMMNDE